MSRTIKKNDNFCFKCGKPYWNDGRTTGIGLCQCDKTVKDDDSIDDLLEENFMKHKITFENSKIKITFENSKIKATFEYPAEYSAKEVADPLDTGAGIAEPEGGGYERVICNSWDEAASRATANTADVVFPEATGDWGTITHFALFDAITAGNMLAHGALAVSKTVDTGIDAKFAAGDIDVVFNTGGMSTYLANALLDHLLKTTPFSVPTNIYVALATDTIVDTDTGTTITEPAGGSYARIVCNGWDAAAAGLSDNTAAITFETATGDWGVCTDACLVDASTVGNLLFYLAADNSRNPDIGDTAQFDAGAFDVTLD